MPRPYAFNERGNVKLISTSNATMVGYFHMVNLGIKLTRAQKDEMFHLLQSNCRRSYKLMGVSFPFWMVLKKYWVQYEHGSISEIFAPDKTSIRSSYYTNRGIIKIVEIK